VSKAPENSLENNPFGTQDEKRSNDHVQGADEAPDQSKGKRSEAAATQQQGQTADQDDSAPAGASADQDDEDAGTSGQGSMDANPMRSLGSVAKHWEQRLNVQDKSEGPPPEKQEQDPGLDATYEFMGDDDDGEEDTQVLAPATDNQASEQQAPQNMPEEAEQKQGEKEEKKKKERMEVDPEADENTQRRSGVGENSKPEEQGEEMVQEEEQQADEEDAPEEEAAMEVEPGENEISQGIMAMANGTDFEIEEHRAQIEKLLQASREGQAGAEVGSEEMWRHLECLTGEYSRELCEMLRLVLEPTLATRLMGGYRQGERIGMKKVKP